MKRYSPVKPEIPIEYPRNPDIQEQYEDLYKNSSRYLVSNLAYEIKIAFAPVINKMLDFAYWLESRLG